MTAVIGYIVIAVAVILWIVAENWYDGDLF